MQLIYIIGDLYEIWIVRCLHLYKTNWKGISLSVHHEFSSWNTHRIQSEEIMHFPKCNLIFLLLMLSNYKFCLIMNLCTVYHNTDLANHYNAISVPVFHCNERAGCSVVQNSACHLKVVSLILAHGTLTWWEREGSLVTPSRTICFIVTYFRRIIH